MLDSISGFLYAYHGASDLYRRDSRDSLIKKLVERVSYILDVLFQKP